MYLFLAFLAGIAINIMVAFNGVLTEDSGVYTATLIAYVVAAIFSGLYLLIRKQAVFPKKKLPIMMYSAGIIGVFSAVFTNFAFGKISLVAITALTLLAQTITSFIIDAFGLLGAEKRPVNKSTIICLLISFAGMLVLLFGAELNAISAVLVSLASGITLVVSRMINADLAKSTGAVSGAFINHLVGIPAGLAALLLLGRGEPAVLSCMGAIPWWAYLGGIVGVIVVIITNSTVPKISAFQATLLIFVGQIVAGIIIDMLTGVAQSKQFLAGVSLISAGVIASAVTEKSSAPSENPDKR